MNLGDIQYPKKEELQVPANIDGPWLDRILLALNTNVRNIEQVLRENVELDNTPYRRITPKLQHGVESLIANPLPGKRRCKGARIINCDGQQPIGCPIIRNTTKGGEPQIGITVQYAPPLGYAKFYRSAAINAANGDNIVDLDATEFAQGGIVYTAGTGIVMPSAGIVRVEYACEWTAAAGGTFRLIYVSSGGNIYADERDGPNVPFGGSGSTLLQIAAGNGIALRTGQDSGAPIALTVGSRRINMSAQYVAPDPATTAQCTIILEPE